LRQRAKDNFAKGPPPQTDTIRHEPQQRVDMRFTDVQTHVQPIQPAPVPQSRSIPPSRGKVKVPKKGRSGEQEMGIVQ